MIPVDLSTNCEDWIYDPNGSGIQFLGIRSRDPFSGSMDMSALQRFFAFLPTIFGSQVSMGRGGRGGGRGGGGLERSSPTRCFGARQQSGGCKLIA